MDDLVERKLEMLFRDLKPYADKPTGSLRIGMDEVQAILSLQARIQALETSLAEAEGRVKALMIALHDAVRRPMGVVPESAEPFYLPSVADQVRLRLASDALLDRQGKEGV